MTNVTIIDYGIGNIKSVLNMTSYLNANNKISSDPREILNSDHLILPGVGSFTTGIKNLKKKNLDSCLLEAVLEKKIKFLGICLGMQLLASYGEEDQGGKGLNLIEGVVRKFDNSCNYKVPHIGFNSVNTSNNSILFKGIPSMSSFYFVHSYYLSLTERVGKSHTCNYINNFLAAYENENIFATQFHPEKSQTNGLLLMKNFLKA